MALTDLAALAVVVVGAVAVAAGCFWIYPPAGLIAAGVESIVAGYVIAYLGRVR